MSGIVTRGYGSKNLIISKGYGLWEKVKKKAIEVISRTIPKRRKRVQFYFPVYGDVVHRFEMEVPIRGEKDFRKMLWLLREDED